LDIWGITLDNDDSGELAHADELCREFDGFAVGWSRFRRHDCNF
jgi:hypothetical protein